MAEKQTKKDDYQSSKKQISKLKIALLTLGVLVAICVVRAVWVVTGTPTIRVNYVAELNRILKPSDYKPAENAILDYEAAIALLIEMPKEIGWRRRGWGFEGDWPGDMNDVQIDVLRNWVASNSETLACLRRGSVKPYHWKEGFAVDNDLMRYEQDFRLLRDIRQAGLLVSWAAKLEAMDGQFINAIDDIVTDYRMGSQLTGRRLIIDQLVGMAVKAVAVRDGFLILQRAQLDSQTMEQLQQKLESVISESEREVDFECIRPMVNDLVQRVFTDNGRGNGHLIPGRIAKWHLPAFRGHRGGVTKPTTFLEERAKYHAYGKIVWLALTGPDRRQTVKTLDKLLTYFEEIKGQSPWQLHNKGVDADKQIRDMVKNYLVLESGLSPGYSLIQMFQRFQAEESALITTIAVLRYEADRGQLPKKLEELIWAGYLTEVPMDPYSDGPLVYKRSGSGFTLYSVGADFDDDGGMVSGSRRSWGEEGGDKVFWPVEKPVSKKPARPRRILKGNSDG
ncbi:MAG: hypothetical protein ACYSP9_00135 [Planctomycetota bacterium]|jgi:hypothetical protein